MCLVPELMAAISILGNADVVVSTCVGAANEVIVNAASITGASSGGPLRWGATGTNQPAPGRAWLARGRFSAS